MQSMQLPKTWASNIGDISSKKLAPRVQLERGGGGEIAKRVWHALFQGGKGVGSGIDVELHILPSDGLPNGAPKTFRQLRRRPLVHLYHVRNAVRSCEEAVAVGLGAEERRPANELSASRLH